MVIQPSKSLKGKVFASREARRWAFRNRVLEMGSYKAVSHEVTLPIWVVRRIAGNGLTRLHHLQGWRDDE